jgi:hypothetical protein
MPTPNADATPREIAAFVLPGAVGVGLGAFVGLVSAESLVAIAGLAVVFGVAGHALGYLRWGDR